MTQSNLPEPCSRRVCLFDMPRFRFVTPHRCGKWYPDLTLAQRYAAALGAGFLEPRGREFYLYPGTRLEVAGDGGDDAPSRTRD